MHLRKCYQSELEKLAKLDYSASLTPWSLNNYTSSFNNSKHHIYVLEHNGQIFGAIVFSMIADEGGNLTIMGKPNPTKKRLWL